MSRAGKIGHLLALVVAVVVGGCDASSNDPRGLTDTMPGDTAPTPPPPDAAPMIDTTVPDAGLDAGPDDSLIEQCNNRDDDGDGKTDEDIGGSACAARRGGCRFEGTITCRRGDLICEADETCNAVDDDCDGDVDEAIAPREEPCQIDQGPCSPRGHEHCVEGMWTCVADSPPPGSDEVCNGLDDDCDGNIDEGEPCAVGVGACTVPGRFHCIDGDAVCMGDEPLPAPTDEICNTIDDDCDGLTDEGRPEECDGIDNDCDGLIDEALPSRGRCSAGYGPCRVEDDEQCVGGEWQCPAVADLTRSAPETCNGLDDDCDGHVDATRPDDVVDNAPVCGSYVTQNCRLWLGWSHLVGGQEPGPEYDWAYDGWSVCPDDYPQLEGAVRCNATEGFENFHLIPVDGDDGLPGPTDHYVGDNDKLAWALECGFALRDEARRDDEDPRLVQLPSIDRFVMDHCSAYLAHGNGPATPAGAFAPDGARDWPPCVDDVARGRLEDSAAACNSTSRDFRFRPLQFPRLVNETDVIGVAFRCDDGLEDPVERRLAAAIERDVEVLFAWAPPMTDGVRDQWPTWAGACERGAVPPGDDGAYCVGSAGDRAFHAVRLAEGDTIGFFGFALKSRPRTNPLGEPR